MTRLEVVDDEKRYCTIEESLIESCKEVNLMRKGLLPEIDCHEAILREEHLRVSICPKAPHFTKFAFRTFLPMSAS